MVDGVENWSTEFKVNGKNGYVVYTQEAKDLGLTAGGLWPHFKDWPHVQLRSADSPLDAMTLQEVNDTMKERFGG